VTWCVCELPAPPVGVVPIPVSEPGRCVVAVGMDPRFEGPERGPYLMYDQSTPFTTPENLHQQGSLVKKV